MRIDATKLGRAVDKVRDDGPEAVLEVLAKTISKLPDSAEAAGALCWVLKDRTLPPQETARIFQQVLDAHSGDTRVILSLGDAIEAARDIDDLNAPPPAEPLFAGLLKRLEELQLRAETPSQQRDFAESLATTARMMGRQKGAIAERAYARVVQLDPDSSDAHYNQGLFFKTRGRFAEGVAANQHAIALAEHPSEGAKWNLGICATGAGQSEVALEVWKGLGNKLEIGRFGLPDGGYPACKVRLAERPLAERDATSDDPGQEETIWIQRLSPCHGIVRSVLYADLGVDFGDVVLFDGAPITYHRYGDKQIAVFPHLATLRHSGYNFYDFSATQPEHDAVASLSDRLSHDSAIYSHTESMVSLCATCWRDETVQHERHEQEQHNVVHGRIAAPPEIGAADLLAQIDAAIAEVDGASLFSPELCLAAGQEARARLEQRRFDTLRGD